MATRTRFEGDYFFAGDVAFSTVTIPASAITNAAIAASAGISSSKLEHQHERTYAQPNTAATTETRAIHVVYGATGTVISFKAGSIAKAVGDSTVTVDLRKNGTTMLTAVITLDNANVNRVSEAGTLVGTPTVVVGDLLEVVITATIGTGTLPTGAYCALALTEAAA